MAGLAEQQFQVSEEKTQTYTFFKVKGAMNSQNTHEVRRRFLDAATRDHVLLDMSEVELIVSTGIGLLFEMSEQLSRGNKKLVLIQPSSRVQQVISMTGFTEMFSYAPSRIAGEKLLA
ncbi:STAS domain-containing protein [Turneriella parva]|jgi:anti-anti-sigma factor|uniref:Anti-sigma factor antagonist n=1 Tax=Turneriella parva (strain ATCC BAA-1111 / DSM 21527 / NCTC 11395 / H) TaxID=869212 RepID=I4B5Y0_TURPD|nr:STAS domain-containing protein [Turneriella parva]AFM12687.1 anti-anti-sigma factor [Turneriella parva DSM 21527]